MTSTGQRCPLCSESLLKFLFNPNGDYILNCSSRVCLYGVLHARVFHADQPPPAEEAASIMDGAPGTCDVAVPVGSSFGGGDGKNAFNEVSNQVDLFSTFGEMDDKGTISMMDMTTPTGPTDSFPESFDFFSESRDGDEDMINQWVRELTEPSSTAVVPSPATPTVPDLPPASSIETKVDLKPEPVPDPETCQSKSAAMRATRRVPRPSTRNPFVSVPVARKTGPIIKRQPEKPVAKLTKPKLLLPKLEKPAKLPARLQKNQAIASKLKNHLGATDDVPSEASSDSGIQSDASSDLSNSSSSLTPIQRLLHIEEAKKRSWGVTGMPGFKPSAGTKDRPRKRPPIC